MRGLLILAFMALLSGCFQAGSNDNEESPPSTLFHIYVEPGTWKLLWPDVEPNEGYSIHYDQSHEYRGYEVRSTDAFECAVFGISDGWFPGATTYRTFNGPYVGRREDGTTTWTNLQWGTAGGDPSGFVMGISEHPERDAWFLAGHDLYGSGVTSNLTIDPDDEPLYVSDEGRFWCLAGPSRFSGGRFLAMHQFIDAADLGWTQTFQDGILVRLQAEAESLSWHLEGPDGEHAPPPELFTDGQADATFCSPLEGEWTLVVDRLESPMGSSWDFVATVFDIEIPRAPCEGEWAASSFGRTPF